MDNGEIIIDRQRLLGNMALKAIDEVVDLEDSDLAMAILISLSNMINHVAEITERSE